MTKQGITVSVIILIAAVAIAGLLIFRARNADVNGQPVTIDTVSAGSADGCYIGGCSQQLCTDQKDMVSTCEYRAEYACYKTATCERQADDTCGWTQTSELTACLSVDYEGNLQK